MSDRNEWIKSLEGNSVVIQIKSVKSIAELFTDFKLSDFNFPDTARLKQFYTDKLKKYCEIVLGKPCIEPTGCNIKEACPSDKLCVNDDSAPNGFRCDENYVDISRDSCQ